ncbi:MAG: effector binding domain-containing protein [Endomicrobium sp.]|jgi:predicted transcriptional regulator YdeE|uniref:GyrI-like domain-containing protein n=1 Tax=Candidatus Endomicrobiellum cubanum TaxID=3242325 RepID=UPI00282F9570|nr:effector binding domain-containing protein [Endomicrobium sp.]
MVEISKKLYVIDSVRTNNFNDVLIMQKIGGLWQKAYTQVPQCDTKYGVYHDYASDFRGDYTLSVATGTDNGRIKIEFSGKYQCFDVDMSVENPLIETWKKIWSLQINRAYTFDFEKYNPDGTVQIYIAISK